MWDIQQLSGLRAMADAVDPPDRRRILLSEIDRFEDSTASALGKLRAQVVHNDFNSDNILVGPDGVSVSGILDFGDAVYTALVNDVAVMAAYQLCDGPDPAATAIDAIAGYHAVTELSTDELGLLPRLIIARIPDEISNVMFTCTGSEAVDLALRVARFATRASGVIVTSNAYHGVTTAAAEISPSLGPEAPLGSQVRTVAPPDPRQDREQAGQAFAARISQAAADMKRHGLALAAFIVDSLFSTDGIIPEPVGFLRPVIDAVHAAGGIFIADEVQPGFARTGESMWGFQRHGIIPDLVVMGKPMGNGMPIAGVAARAELLAEFGQKIRYFNTFGGNSISVAAASAVLDVIEDEKLAENSRAVGAALRDAIAEAAAGCPGVRDIRGAGLYVGVEFADPQTGEPDGTAALNIVNELRERRVLISATGAHGNILKIRPPLPFSYHHVDQFADALRGSLASPATHR